MYNRITRDTTYLCNHGIRHINRVVPTKSSELFFMFHDGVVALFEYVGGDNTEDYELSRLINVLAHIAKLDQSSLPAFQELSAH